MNNQTDHPEHDGKARQLAETEVKMHRERGGPARVPAFIAGSYGLGRNHGGSVVGSGSSARSSQGVLSQPLWACLKLTQHTLHHGHC